MREDSSQVCCLSNHLLCNILTGLVVGKECFNVARGQQKFVSRRDVTYLNTLETKTESHLEDLGIILLEKEFL